MFHNRGLSFDTGASSRRRSLRAGRKANAPKWIWGISVMVDSAATCDCARMVDQLRATALFVSVPALAIATAWWIGDLSETLVDPDFMFRPMDLSPGTSRAVGLVATAICIAGLVAAVQLTRSDGGGRRLVAVLLPLLALAAYLGLGYRITTAGVTGANIGGGLFMLTSFVVLPLAIGASVAIWWVTRQREVDPGRS